MPQSPRYLQIADDLRRRIESPEFAAGTPLPAEGSLQREYQASRNTDPRSRQAAGGSSTSWRPGPGLGTFVTQEIVPVRQPGCRRPIPKTGLGGGGEEGPDLSQRSSASAGSPARRPGRRR